MAGYRFEALDSGGKVARGVLEVDSMRQARAVLRERGLWTLEIDALAPRAAPGRSRLPRLRRGRRFSVPQLSLLMRQFATLAAANLTVEQALNALIEQADSESTREVLAGVRGEVLAGSSLAYAMERFPRAFPQMYRSLIDAGERSGQLPEVMTRLAD